MKCYGNNDDFPLKLNCEILNEDATCQNEVAWYYLKAVDQGKNEGIHNWKSVKNDTSS